MLELVLELVVVLVLELVLEVVLVLVLVLSKMAKAAHGRCRQHGGSVSCLRR